MMLVYVVLSEEAEIESWPGADRDLHSGVYGGAGLLTNYHLKEDDAAEADEKIISITINSGFYDDVVESSDALKESRYKRHSTKRV